MSCLFADRPEYGNTTLLDFTNNGNANDLPFYYKVHTACQMAPHRHTYIQMVYVRRGELTHVCGSHITELRCGDLLLMPPYIPHYFIPIAERVFELVEFEFAPEFIDPRLTPGEPFDLCDTLSWLEPYTDGHHFPLARLSGTLRFDAESALSDIEREYTERLPGFEAVIRALACRLIVWQRRAIATSPDQRAAELLYERHREVLLRSLDYIRENYTQDITVQDAAAVAIMSPSYYRHYFKLLTHKTFTEYINGLRVAHAITLVRENASIKIVDICYATGFTNISHFNRTFLKITGVTPKAFRRPSEAGKLGDAVDFV